MVMMLGVDVQCPANCACHNLSRFACTFARERNGVSTLVADNNIFAGAKVTMMKCHDSRAENEVNHLHVIKLAQLSIGTSAFSMFVIASARPRSER